jgi:predicted naringenin-chalcone synthase
LDVLVVGAGVAGPVLARELARLGVRVALVDAAKFPRGKVCGCCLNPSALASLEAVGLGDVAEASGALPLRELRWSHGPASASIALPGGVAVSRERLDAELVRRAVAAGVLFSDGTPARVRGGGVTLGRLGRPARGSSSRPTAAGGGGAGAVPRAAHRRPVVGRGRRGPRRRRSVLRGRHDLDGVGAGRLRRGGSGRGRPLRRGGGARPAAREGVGRPRGGRLGDLAGTGWPALPFASAGWKGTPPLTRRPARAGRPRLAGGRRLVRLRRAVHTGEGMAWALASARLAVPHVLAGLRGEPSTWAETFRLAIRPRQRVCRLVATGLRSAGRRGWPSAVRPVPGVGRADCRPPRRPGPPKNEAMNPSILGVGTATPPCRVPQADALRAAKRLGTGGSSPLLETVYRRSGISSRSQVLGERFMSDVLNESALSGSPFLPDAKARPRGPSTAERMAVYAREAPPLAVEAARAALLDSGTPAARVTHLVTASCTGFDSPGVDVSLIEELGLSPSAERVQVGFMGCHAAVNALRAARAISLGDPSAVVLLTCVELCSIHYHYGDAPDRLVANAIFADGAAALVMGRGDGPEAAATGSRLIPGSRAAMAWSVGDHGFEMTLGKEIPKLIETHLGGWLGDWLASHGLTREAVGGWAVHPGGSRILDAAGRALGLAPDDLADSRAVFAEYGNMSSPTVLFVLRRMMLAGRPRPWVLLGFGPGVVAEAALIR